MPSLLFHLLLKRTLAWALGLAGLTGALCFVPLFNTLGYELALVLALVVSFAAAHLGSVVVATTRHSDDSLLMATRSGPSVAGGIVLRAVTVGWALLAIPLALICLNALRVRNCDMGGGLLLFALLPLCSATIAATVGSLWALILPRAGWASLAALVTVVASVAWSAYRFYAEPPICGYDPFFGYFAGSLYDESIAPLGPLVYARLYQLSAATVAVLCAALWTCPAELRLRPRVRGTPRTLWVGLGVALVAASTLAGFRRQLGFYADAAHIVSELGGLRRTTHFEIIYPRRFDGRTVERLVEDHEFRYAQLQALFGRGPELIRSYVFPNAATKKRLLGTGGVLVAKPWRNEIYLEASGFPARALKHELAHVFAARHGDGLLGLSLAWRPYPRLNVGLLEGLAVAADWPAYGELDGHQRAAVLQRTGRAPPLSAVFGLRFWSHAQSRAYGVAGSFCRFLIERHGMGKLLRAYRRAGDFEQVYGETLQQLGARWKAQLQRVHIPPAQMQLARERLRRRSIFRRVCPHEVAAVLHQARQRTERKQHAGAVAAYQRARQMQPGEVTHVLAQADALAAASNLPAATRLLSGLLASGTVHGPLQRRASERLGNLHWLRRDLAAADLAYTQAIAHAAGPGKRRVLHLKRWALNQPEPHRSVTLRYLIVKPGRARSAARDIHLAYRLAELLPGSGIGLYLVAKQLAVHDQLGEAISPMRRALRRGLPSSDFEREAYRVLGQCAYAVGDLPLSREAFLGLAQRTAASPGERVNARQWLARVAWRETGTVVDGSDGLHASPRSVDR